MSFKPAFHFYIFLRSPHGENRAKRIPILNRDLCCQIPYIVLGSSTLAFKVSCHSGRPLSVQFYCSIVTQYESFSDFYFSTIISNMQVAHYFNTTAIVPFSRCCLSPEKLVICEPGIGARMIFPLTIGRY